MLVSRVPKTSLNFPGALASTEPESVTVKGKIKLATTATTAAIRVEIR